MGHAGDTIYTDAEINTLFLEQGIIGTWSEEFFREHAPRIAAMVDEYSPASWDMSKSGGEMYTLPGVSYQYMIPELIVWNQTWLDKLGVESVPNDLSAWEEIFYRMTKEDPDGNGVNDTYGLSEGIFQAIYGAFGFQREMWLSDGNGGVVYGDVMPGAKDALALLAKWYNDGVIAPEFITGENQTGYWALTHAFINQRIGSTCHGHYYHWTDLTGLGIDYALNNAKEIANSANPFKTSYSQPPVGPDGLCGIKRNGPALIRNTFKASLAEDTERFARLLEIIDDMSMDPEMALIAEFGIEGEDWDWKEFAPGVRQPLLRETNNAPGNAFNWNGNCVEHQQTRDVMGALFVETYMSGWLDKYYENQVLATLPSATLYNTECEKILNEGYIAIITGEKPVEYFDEMVTAWNNAGSAILTQEANVVYAEQND